ncbi:MAG: hypothetical protein ACYC8T_29555 [Myxococcaceae bacterium]
MPRPIRPTNPGAVSSTTPSVPAAPAKPAAPAEKAPRAWSGRPLKGADGFKPGRVATGPAAQAGAAGRTSVDLVPGRYPDAVGLPVILEKLGASPEGKAMVQKVLADLQAKTGVAVPKALADRIAANPTLLTRALEMTPAQLSRGIDALNGAYRAGKIKQVPDRATALPQRFDLKDLAAFDLPRQKPELKQLAPGLFQGSLPSTLSDAQLKSNVLTAEVFDRLSSNPGKPADKAFSVQYGGQSYEKLGDFLDALKKDGHEVSVSFDQRVANFSDLKTPVPGSNPPVFVDVPAPVMVKTGIKGPDGAEALVPAAHAEMVIHIRKGPGTRGPGVDADVKYYQGISGTGFFPCDTTAQPSWCGKVSSDPLQGDAAMKAVKLAAAFSDVVNDAAKKADLYCGGYGLTGVCNDSVAVVQQAMTGKTTMYPLLMRDQVLTGELRTRLGDSDGAHFQELLRSIEALPSDARANSTARSRALSSLPWAPGREPFASSEAARKILSSPL